MAAWRPRASGRAYREMAGSFDPVRELPDGKAQLLKESLRQPAAAVAWSTWGECSRRQPLLWSRWRWSVVAATQAEVRLHRQRREVRLVEGQALFAVRAVPDRPFDVLPGAARSTVVGTRFSFRHTRAGPNAGRTVEGVESGRLRVSRLGSSGEAEKGGPAGGVELGAWQGVAADQTGYLQPFVSTLPHSVAGWRNGRVSFDDTPLAEALAELERYGDTGLLVRDPAVGALRLGGSFDLRQTGLFARALPSLLPVRLERRNGMVEIARRQ